MGKETMAIPDSTEIALCIDILNRISPQDLPSLPPDLLECGHRLFGRSIKAKLFGEKDIVAFFKERDDYQFLLRKLTRVHEEVARAHVDLVEAAACSGINSIREARAADVNTLGVSALTTEASLLTLIQSISTNIQLPYHMNTENALDENDSDDINKMYLTDGNSDQNGEDTIIKSDANNTVVMNKVLNTSAENKKTTEKAHIPLEPSPKTRKLKGCKSSDDFRVGGHMNRNKGPKAAFNVRICIYICKCVYVNMHLYVHFFMCICIQTHVYTYICIHIYIHICIYIYIYMQVSQIRGLYDDADDEMTDGKYKSYHTYIYRYVCM
jgi:hypothetical protein